MGLKGYYQGEFGLCAPTPPIGRRTLSALASRSAKAILSNTCSVRRTNSDSITTGCSSSPGARGGSGDAGSGEGGSLGGVAGGSAGKGGGGEGGGGEGDGSDGGGGLSGGGEGGVARQERLIGLSWSGGGGLGGGGVGGDGGGCEGGGGDGGSDEGGGGDGGGGDGAGTSSAVTVGPPPQSVTKASPAFLPFSHFGLVESI
eukprot:scaffold109490_cov43-Phaeocystis_antarctica.AAC.2